MYKIEKNKLLIIVLIIVIALYIRYQLVEERENLVDESQNNPYTIATKFAYSYFDFNLPNYKYMLKETSRHSKLFESINERKRFVRDSHEFKIPFYNDGYSYRPIVYKVSLNNRLAVATAVWYPMFFDNDSFINEKVYLTILLQNLNGWNVIGFHDWNYYKKNKLYNTFDSEIIDYVYLRDFNFFNGYWHDDVFEFNWEFESKYEKENNNMFLWINEEFEKQYQKVKELIQENNRIPYSYNDPIFQ